MNERTLTQAPASVRRSPQEASWRTEDPSRRPSPARDPRSTKALVQAALAHFGLSAASRSRG